MPGDDVVTGGTHVRRGLLLAVLVVLVLVGLAYAARHYLPGGGIKAGFAGGAVPCVGCGGVA